MMSTMRLLRDIQHLDEYRSDYDLLSVLFFTIECFNLVLVDWFEGLVKVPRLVNMAFLGSHSRPYILCSKTERLNIGRIRQFIGTIAPRFLRRKWRK